MLEALPAPGDLESLRLQKAEVTRHKTGGRAIWPPFLLIKHRT